MDLLEGLEPWPVRQARLLNQQAEQKAYRMKIRQEKTAFKRQRDSEIRRSLNAQRKLDDPDGYKAEVTERFRNWRANNPEKYRKQQQRMRMRFKYGLNPEERTKIFEAQGSVCAVCGASTPCHKGGRWQTDHCHLTGQVRGILCHHCNVGLGHFKDNTTTLANAIKYLEKHSGRERREARPELPPHTWTDQAPGERLQCPP